jgi:hypothetical protein
LTEAVKSPVGFVILVRILLSTELLTRIVGERPSGPRWNQASAALCLWALDTTGKPTTPRQPSG